MTGSEPVEYFEEMVSSRTVRRLPSRRGRRGVMWMSPINSSLLEQSRMNTIYLPLQFPGKVEAVIFIKNF